MIARIRALRGSEPIRLVVYPVLVLLVGYAVLRGVIDGSVATGLLAVAAVVLGVPAVEAARAQVTPTGKIADVVTTATDLAAVEARDIARDRFGDQGTEVVDAVVEQIKARIRSATR